MDRVSGFILMNVTTDLSISAELAQSVADTVAETEPEVQPSPAAEAEPEQPAPAPEAEPEQPAPEKEAEPEQPAPEAEPEQPAPAAEAIPENYCQVTCSGCVFTYHAGGLRSASSGAVPKGAAIIVSSGGEQAGASGYSINGGDPEHIGSSSFRLIIEEDTFITVP